VPTIHATLETATMCPLFAAADPRQQRLRQRDWSEKTDRHDALMDTEHRLDRE
jgi:hypothetical protein